MREKIEKKKEQAKKFVKKNWKKILVYGAAGYGVFKAGMEIYAAYRGFDGCDLHFYTNQEKQCIDLDIIGKGKRGGRFGMVEGTHISVEEMTDLRDWIDETIQPIPEKEETTE